MTEFSVEREAKLFEAGSYPDKGIDVTEEDLDAIVANHDPATPIKIEHQPTAFDGAMGCLSRIWRKGKELMGSLAWTDEAWALVEKAGIKSLSVGIKRDKTGLAEVSLVREPRIADARVFSGDTVGFSIPLGWDSPPEQITEEVKTMPEVVAADMTPERAAEVLAAFNAATPKGDAVKDATDQVLSMVETADKRMIAQAQKAEALMKHMQRMETNNTIFRLKREGKITPAAEPFARAILEALPLEGVIPDVGECVKFSKPDGTEVVAHFAQMFLNMMDANAPVVNFRELAMMGETGDAISAEQARINAMLGVSTEDFRKVHGKGQVA